MVVLLLATSQVGGFFGLLGLFLLSVAGVLVVKFARMGWRQYVRGNGRKTAERTGEKKAEQPQAQEEKPRKKTEQGSNDSNPAPPETVYYIVERKKRRPKTEYSEPKEFRFK